MDKIYSWWDNCISEFLFGDLYRMEEVWSKMGILKIWRICILN